MLIQDVHANDFSDENKQKLEKLKSLKITVNEKQSFKKQVKEYLNKLKEV